MTNQQKRRKRYDHASPPYNPSIHITLPRSMIAVAAISWQSPNLTTGGSGAGRTRHTRTYLLR